MATHDEIEKALTNAGLAEVKITSPVKVVLEDCLAGLITADEMVERIRTYDMLIEAYADREAAGAENGEGPGVRLKQAGTLVTTEHST